MLRKGDKLREMIMRMTKGMIYVQGIVKYEVQLNTWIKRHQRQQRMIGEILIWQAEKLSDSEDHL